MSAQAATEEDLRKRIKEGFMLDKIMLPPRNEIGEMTAVEVVERTEQMRHGLGPILPRLITEFLNPVFTNSFRMMARKGEFGELPRALQDNPNWELSVEFDNVLSRAQSFEEVANVQKWFSFVQAAAQFDEKAPQVANIPEALHGVGVRIGVPEDYMNSPADINKQNEQDRAVAARGAALEQMNTAASIDTQRNQQT